MDAVWTLLAVVSTVAMLSGAFTRGRDAILRTLGSALVMAGLAFTHADWAVEAGMAILTLSSIQFLYRPYHKVRRELQASLASLVVLLAAAATTHHYPWAVFPVGFMAVLWVITGGPARNRRKEAKSVRREEMRKVSEQAAAAHDSAVDLDRLFNHPRLPGVARERLHIVLRRADALHADLRTRQVSDRLIFEVEQIHEDYAPTAVRSYLALSPATADTAPIEDGKTGAVLLQEQLELLDSALDDIATAAQSAGADGILASHRFLRDKFGPSGDDLRL
ncbi:hypothetical protein [Flexivirga caeni]|uniref:Uncharacterized protein n=1 Tax=Flexivirga caeni TaxID=2294115 RepID=A0A3M9M4K5_9MICO|nr:hypothetical protein [Flexivirga caeni]RNI20491.1 hypothetical protein EFY87_14790 [Flexivirga caeni]